MDGARTSSTVRRRVWHAPARWRPLVYAVGLVPAVWTIYLGLTDQLGADPMRVLERSLGLWGLRFLILGLAVTPLLRLGGPNLLAWRRAFGLIAFTYVVLHLSTYLVLDQGLNLKLIVADLVKRTYITVGMAAFVLLVPLAVTSNDALIRRMGAVAWRRLHWLVYPAVAGGATHFILSVKSWPPEPTIYLALVVVLLGWRVFGTRRPTRARARGAGVHP